jgi:hypothetical protein
VLLALAALVLSSCGLSPPNENAAEAAISKYVGASSEPHDAAFRNAEVVQIGPCAIAARGSVCPVELQLANGEQRRAFVTLSQSFLEWTASSFEPIED